MESLLTGTTLGEYCRARKARATANAESGLPARSPVPLLLNQNETASSALLKLAAFRVTSAPLVSWMSDGLHYSVTTFVSVGDLLEKFLEHPSVLANAPSSLPCIPRMAVLSSAGLAFGATSLASVRTEHDGTSVWTTAAAHLTLEQVCRSCMLCDSAPAPGLGHHRVAVVDASKAVTDIVSMSDIVAYCYNNAAQLPEVKDKTLGELGLGQNRVYSVNAATPAVDAFGILRRNKVSAVAIVDDASGALIGNLSDSDFKFLTPPGFGALALPVGEYLMHAHAVNPSLPKQEDAGLGSAPWNPRSTVFGAALGVHARNLTVTCTLNQTLLGTMQHLVRSAVHRVWIVDDTTRPIGCVTLSDVIAALIA